MAREKRRRRNAAEKLSNRQIYASVFARETRKKGGIKAAYGMRLAEILQNENERLNDCANFGTRSGEICELGRRGERKILPLDAAI